MCLVDCKKEANKKRTLFFTKALVKNCINVIKALFLFTHSAKTKLFYTNFITNFDKTFITEDKILNFERASS